MGHHAHHSLHLKPHAQDSVVMGPRKNEAWQVKLTDPAISIMTDFRESVFFTVDATELIDEALARMKHAGLICADSFHLQGIAPDRGQPQGGKGMMSGAAVNCGRRATPITNM